MLLLLFCGSKRIKGIFVYGQKQTNDSSRFFKGISHRFRKTSFAGGQIKHGSSEQGALAGERR